jgi:hypothetical protein
MKHPLAAGQQIENDFSYFLFRVVRHVHQFVLANLALQRRLARRTRFQTEFRRRFCRCPAPSGVPHWKSSKVAKFFSREDPRRDVNRARFQMRR